jgi:hypothetical protein
MIFKTRNSTYEVDAENKRIRRIKGLAEPTPRLSPDGEWKDYREITPVTTFHPVQITWPTVPELKPYTFTAAVVEVDGD